MASTLNNQTQGFTGSELREKEEKLARSIEATLIDLSNHVDQDHSRSSQIRLPRQSVKKQDMPSQEGTPEGGWGDDFVPRVSSFNELEAFLGNTPDGHYNLALGGGERDQGDGGPVNLENEAAMQEWNEDEARSVGVIALNQDEEEEAEMEMEFEEPEGPGQLGIEIGNLVQDKK
jgi:hypothetical protein